MRIVVINHVTLDGVMQDPGRPDEDTRGGFTHGGWAETGNDPGMTDAIGQRMGGPDGGLLLGRRSYEDMLSTWNARGGPFKDGNLVIMGSGRLIRSLLPDALVDEYLLMIHPLLGSGQRLFDRDDRVSRLRLLSSVATDTGVIIAAYAAT